MSTDTATDDATVRPEALRAAMVDHVKTVGHANSPRVEDAMRSVPRHAFVPAATLTDAYADIAVITKRADNGAALSCASVPSIVAMMLDQLGVEPGNRILEVGAGTGYNAALLAHLTGPTGHVTTIDIDPEVTAQARQRLDATGNDHVTVITRDGALGAAEHAPYDRIIFTVGAWDLPPAILEQLAPSGRLVVPLRWRGQTRSIAFTPTSTGNLTSESVELCGFVPMTGQHGEQDGTIDADGAVTLHWDVDQPINPADLTGILDQPRTDVWSGVTIGAYDSFDGIWLRLTSAEAGTCRIAATPDAMQRRLCTPANAYRSPAIIDGESLGYFTQRRLSDRNGERLWELGATGHGPAGPHLAERITDQIHAWNQDRTARPTITAYPINNGRADLPADRLAIAKQHTALTITNTETAAR